jgi:hypothetical protein
MSRQRPQRMRHDQQFWQIVKDLRWKLEDGSAGTVPAAEPEFGFGEARRRLPGWLTHLVVFVLGAVSCATLLMAPAVLPIVGFGVLVAVLLTHRFLR